MLPACPSMPHRTLAAPRPAWTRPQMASRGRTRHRTLRSSSQPRARRLETDSSQCMCGGVWVTTISASSGKAAQMSAAVAALRASGVRPVSPPLVIAVVEAARSGAERPDRTYPKAHVPIRGEYGEPNTLKVVRGPLSPAKRTVAELWQRFVMDGLVVRRDRHCAGDCGDLLWKLAPCS